MNTLGDGPKVYKKCSDIKDLAICKSIKNTQKNPKLSCKPSVDGKTCVDDDKTLVEYLKTKGAKTNAELIEEAKQIKAEAEKKKLEDENAEQEKIKAAEQERLLKKEEEKKLDEETEAKLKEQKEKEIERLKEEEEKKKVEPVVINPPIIIPLIQPGNDDIRTIVLWDPKSVFDNDQRELIKEKLKEQVPKGSEDKISFEIINKEDIDDEIKNWSKGKFEKTVVVYIFSSSSIARIEGHNPDLVKKVISLKVGEETIFPAGRALFFILKIGNPSGIKDDFTEDDLTSLNYNVKKIGIDKFNGEPEKLGDMTGAYRILARPGKNKGKGRTLIEGPWTEFLNANQDKTNLEKFQKQVIIPLLDFKKKEEI